MKNYSILICTFFFERQKTMQSLMKIIFRFLKEYESSIETIRRILRFCFLLYYVFVIPYRICFLRENLRIDDQFLLYNIFDYVVVDIFFLVDSFDILKTRWKRIRKWATAVLPIQESDKKGTNTFILIYIYIIHNFCVCLLLIQFKQ